MSKDKMHKANKKKKRTALNITEVGILNASI